MDIIVPNGNEMHSVMYGWVYWSAWYQDIPFYARDYWIHIIVGYLMKMSQKRYDIVSRNVSHGR